MKNLLFSFEDMSAKDKAAKAVIRYFTKAGAEVIAQDVDTRVKRTSGVSYREMTLTFDDSQQMILRVKQTGDIYQVLLNGKVVPVKNQDNHIKAVEELAAMVQSNRAKFQKALSRVKAEIPKSIKTAAPKLEAALAEKIEATKTAIRIVKEELTAMGVEVV